MPTRFRRLPAAFGDFLIYRLLRSVRNSASFFGHAASISAFGFSLSQHHAGPWLCFVRGAMLAAVKGIASANTIAIPSISVPGGRGVNLSVKALRSWGFAISSSSLIARIPFTSTLASCGQVVI